MNDLAPYQVRAVPRERALVLDLLWAAARRHTVHAFVELDVEALRRDNERRAERGGDAVSLTASVISAVARVAREHQELRSIRVGRRLVTFDRVDVGVVLERTIGARPVPMPTVVRGACTKSVEEIQGLMEEARTAPVGDASEVASFGVFAALPSFIRRLLLLASERFVGIAARYKTPIVVTSLGPLVGRGAAFGAPLAPVTLSVTIGGLVDRPVREGEGWRNHEHVCVTLSFDHDVVDGAPAARFIAQLRRELSGPPSADARPPPG